MECRYSAFSSLLFACSLLTRIRSERTPIAAIPTIMPSPAPTKVRPTIFDGKPSLPSKTSVMVVKFAISKGGEDMYVVKVIDESIMMSV